MQRLLTTVLTLAVIIAALAFVSAPYFAFFALRSAAQAEDVQGLSQLVDYDAVRSSLKAQLTGTASAAPPSFWQDPVGAIQHAIAPLEPTPKVEALLKPAALNALTRGQGWDSIKASKTADASAASPWPRVRFWGVNRCRLGVPSASTGWGETVFTFERKGVFSWKLVQIAMPTKLPAGDPAPVPATPAPTPAPAQ
ncbi:MAG: DUF2939 domain-containing protein [Proteobacteria bacterium]|nr:DUF2939 domain-containing protein [Pseudomonadota bacterium]